MRRIKSLELANRTFSQICQLMMIVSLKTKLNYVLANINNVMLLFMMVDKITVGRICIRIFYSQVYQQNAPFRQSKMFLSIFRAALIISSKFVIAGDISFRITCSTTRLIFAISVYPKNSQFNLYFSCIRTKKWKTVQEALLF